jgi:hypothetical protein
MSISPATPIKRIRAGGTRPGNNWLAGGGRLLAKQAHISRLEPNEEEKLSCTVDPLSDRLDMLEHMIHDLDARMVILALQPSTESDQQVDVATLSNKMEFVESMVASFNERLFILEKSQHDLESSLPGIFGSLLNRSGDYTCPCNASFEEEKMDMMSLESWKEDISRSLCDMEDSLLRSVSEAEMSFIARMDELEAFVLEKLHCEERCSAAAVSCHPSSTKGAFQDETVVCHRSPLNLIQLKKKLPNNLLHNIRGRQLKEFVSTIIANSRSSGVAENEVVAFSLELWLSELGDSG